MNVEQIMNRDVKTCSPSSCVDDAVRIMWDNDCGCVPVVDGESHVVGMLTDRDVCIAAWSRGTPLACMKVSSVMSNAVHSCNPMDSIESAEETMKRERVHRLPVIGHDKQLVGILSLNDIARRWCSSKNGISAESVADTLSKLSERRIKGEQAPEFVLEPVPAALPVQRAKVHAGLVAR
jgi:CBS-domain-containing membrane protein